MPHPPYRSLLLILAFLAASVTAAFTARSYRYNGVGGISSSPVVLIPKTKAGREFVPSPLDATTAGTVDGGIAAKKSKRGPERPTTETEAALIDENGPPTTEEAEADEPCTRRGFLRTTAAAAGAVAAATLCGEADGAAAEEGGGSGGDNDANTSSSSSNVVLADASTAKAEFDLKAILQKSAKRALGGGKAGASAAVVQVCSLMWLRTAMNYQYRYGGTLTTSLQTLYREEGGGGLGGIQRLYQGLPFALVQGPLTRFGDTAANVGVLALLDSIPETAVLPLPLRTAAGSVAAGLWRIVLMPVDTSKTAMQVEGRDGLDSLVRRVVESGPGPLYQGALASAAATAAGHYPWFLTYNALNDYLPVVTKEEGLLLMLVRSAFLGLAASCVSDCVSNSLRVIKTTKQTAGLGAGGGDAAAEIEADGKKTKEITYREALNIVLEKDGVRGLFGRGLKTRLLTNAIQGAAFSVLWKYFQNMQQ